MPESTARGQELAERLSTDELEMLRCIVAGESQKAIACRLGLDEADALAVRHSLMRKLRANFTADAVREGIYAGL